MTKRELNLDITPAVERALGAMLRLLHRYGSRRGVPAKALALDLWPHSTSWIHNRKPGVSYRQEGKGATYAATNMLIRMVRMGLAEEAEEGYRLTGKGVVDSLLAARRAEEAELRKARRNALKEQIVRNP